MAGAPRAFRAFVGVDLGGGKGKKTAVALLERSPRPADRGSADGVVVKFVGTRCPEGRLLYDEQLLGFLLAQQDALLAVDAPLSPTTCLRCRRERCAGLAACPDPVIRWFRETGDPLVVGDGPRAHGKPPTTPYTQRACEVLLHRRHGILPRETFGQGMGPLTARAHFLRRALEQRYELNRNLIEVYPKATVQLLFGAEAARRYKREVNTWRTRARILEALSAKLRFEIWREGCLRNDHCFDALIAAYTGYLWASEGWTMPDEGREVFEQDGWIWIPPADAARKPLKP